MLGRRVVVCLDVDAGRVVKGVRFRSLRDQGDPVSLARRYEDEGADELVLLDISATVEERRTVFDLVRRVARQVYIPLTLGGGMRSSGDVEAALRSGADKVAVNSGAVARPSLISELSARFGAQCVVASIDAARVGGAWRVHTHGGREATSRDAVAWARTCADLGAGEILLTSIDRDGGREGYDLELTAAVAAAVGVPVIASGGAGTAGDVVAVLQAGGADAALVAGIVHEGQATIREIKREMERAGLAVRAIA
jgi:cyclase